ncbi:MAG: PAS domain-containing protein, partial [Alphaproteobacteria bacterium]|nr:PAS domain-containing protein [Alphaproteobacteria bacterium]
MLKDINNRRPDRQLERNLVFLAYAIMFLSLSLFALFIYPQYFIYIVISLVVFNVLCILITIRILKVSENAIGFGTLAAELLNDKNRYYRVDNSEGEAIIINRAAIDYFQNLPILTFLEKNIIPSQANKMDLQKLVSAVNKLQEITINLSISPNKNSIFVAEEWLRINVKPIYLNKADIFEDKFSLNKIRKETYLFWTVENITAYKNMDNVFKNEMTSLHNFLDFLPVGLYTCDAEGKIEYINNLLAENLNTDKNNAIGRKIDEFVAHKPELLHTPDGTYNDNILFQTAHGIKEAFVKQQNVRENNELKTRGVVIFDLPNDTDLTAKLNILTDKFEHLLDTAPLGIIFLDNKQNIMQTNSYICNFFAQSESALIGTKINKYFDDKTYDKIYEASLAYSKNQTGEFSCDSVLTINEENRNISLNIYPLQMPHSASKNNIDGMIIYLRDTSNRRNLEMQVAQAQKMQAFGQLAGGVAHDFNNLLTAVVGYCDLLIRRHGIGDPSFTDLVELKNNVTRAIGVARQLLTISRQQPLNPKLID